MPAGGFPPVRGLFARTGSDEILGRRRERCCGGVFPRATYGGGAIIACFGAILHAPDLIYAEVANVVWKRHRRREIDDDEALDILADLLDLPLEITPSDLLLRVALEMAVRTKRTVYDCLYVALAVQRKTVMLSDDQRLVNALAAGPLKSYAAWLGQQV